MDTRIEEIKTLVECATGVAELLKRCDEEAFRKLATLTSEVVSIELGFFHQPADEPHPTIVEAMAPELPPVEVVATEAELLTAPDIGQLLRNARWSHKRGLTGVCVLNCASVVSQLARRRGVDGTLPLRQHIDSLLKSNSISVSLKISLTGLYMLFESREWNLAAITALEASEILNWTEQLSPLLED